MLQSALHKRYLIAGLLLGVALLMLHLRPVWAAAVAVNTCDAPSLNAAITAANPGDTIDFNCNGTIVLAAELNITRDLIFDGRGQSVTLSGGNLVRVMYINRNITVTIYNLTITNGNSTSGAGIMNFGVLNLYDSVISNNRGTSGAGISTTMFGSLTVNNSTFSNNQSSGPAGGLFANGIITINNSTFVGNSATTGGAMFICGDLIMTNSTLSANTASMSAGALNINCRSTFVDSSTFVNNSAPTGGSLGGFNRMTISRSIVTNGDCNGPLITDGGDNLQFNAPGCVGAAGDPLLQPLGNYGGLTQTFALGTGSPALDAYTTGCPASDQRGIPRPQNIGCDIGAFEAQFAPAAPGELPVLILPTLPPPPSCVEMNDSSFMVPAGLYCQVLMRHNLWIAQVGSVDGAVTQLGVVIAVEVVYYDVPGHASNEFVDGQYRQVCLLGTGRFLYADGRNALRTWAELTSETVNGYSCAWIAAPGTIALVEN
ncbi:MAG: right-handed parallel beta-helix repeat-containing protein [Anaerolineae bacterium]